MPASLINRRPAGLPPIEEVGDLPAHVARVAALRGLGYSLRQIGRSLGCSPQAVSLHLIRFRNDLRRNCSEPEMRGLSTRAVNVLGRLGISTRLQARHSDLDTLLAGQRNCGAKTRQEIFRWANRLPAPFPAEQSYNAAA